MKIELVKQEVLRFLSTKEPEVICVKGRWGVGKTYAWRQYLNHANANNNIALSRYAYVSLFGLNSLDDLKYAIFESSVKSSEIDFGPSIATVSQAVALAERVGRKSVGFLQQLAWVKSHIGVLGPAWFLTVRDTIVCLDDVERRGKGLSIREALGLLSMLKEQRRCKIALILNDEAEDREPTDFQTYYEKVIDVTLKFEPSPEECIGIALSEDTPATKLLARNCIMLRISNIRLIKKIERSVRELEKIANFLQCATDRSMYIRAAAGFCGQKPVECDNSNLGKCFGADFTSISATRTCSTYLCREGARRAMAECARSGA